ncbi:MAG: hypothetical protein Q9222_003115 [Ikaeria aurantiellina]
MPNGDFVDLSLSTDDEATAAGKKTLEPQTCTRTNSEHRPSPEGFIDIDGYSRKRRKLSPPLPTHKKIIAAVTGTERAYDTELLPTAKANTCVLNIDDDDPIFWTSSPKLATTAQPVRQGSKEQQWTDLPGSDDSLPDERWLREARQVPAQPRNKSKKAADLSKACQSTGNEVIGKKGKNNERTAPTISSSHPSDGGKNNPMGEERQAIERSTSATIRKSNLTEEDKADRARARDEAKAATRAFKLREKEEAQEQRRLLKEEQAREKQKDKDRAEANKLKLDKKLSTPEMIIDLPLSVDGTSVDTQIKEFLKQIGVKVTSYPAPCPNVIKWRRKVDSRFNVDTGQREKLQVKEIDTEKHVMCLMAAEEFVELATAGGSNDSQMLDDHVKRIRAAFNECVPIYLFEGLDVWFRKNRIAQNRAYQTAVLGQDDTTKRSTTAARHKKQQTGVVNEDIIEDALVRLQVVHNCLIHHTAATVETAEWVAHFTEQISQIPYRNEQMARDSNFCMDSGQVKCGKDPEETFINMLLANVRVTAPIAYGIAAKYANVDRLVQGFEVKGPLALEHLKVRESFLECKEDRHADIMVQKSANKDGSLADRSIGPAISRRLHKVFTDLDPTSTDI